MFPSKVGLYPIVLERIQVYFSENEIKNYYPTVSFSLRPRGEATYIGLRMLRGPRSPGWLRFRARVAHGFCTTATCAYPLGDDNHHHNDPGHDARRGRRKPRQCYNCDYNARRKNHHRDRSTASAPVGGRAGSAVSQLCVGRRLLDMAQQWVSMDGGPLGIAAEPGFRVGRTALGAAR